MKKWLGRMLVAMLLMLAYTHVALAASNSDAGRLREDALTTGQLSEGTGTVFGSDILRSEITGIEFLNNLDSATDGAWDVSASGDGSVLAWVDDGTLTLAANGGVRAPRNGAAIFANYSNATDISFNDCFDTSDTENMFCMFSGCAALQTLELSGFDTSNAANMAFMFDDCRQLKSLNVSGFDTSRTKDMNSMFQFCSSLEVLDVSGFDTSSVTAMDYMFNGCSRLITLDLSEFDTREVTTLKRMFFGCKALQEIRMSQNFAVKDGVVTEDMFTKTNATIVLDGVTMTAEAWLSGDAAPALASSKWPRLREDIPTGEQFENNTGIVLGSERSRDEIVSVVFLGSLDGAPEDAWDASASGDGSVLAWMKDGALTVAGDGGVRAPENAFLLFSNYKNATSIRFNGCFDTSETYNMQGMFYGCAALKTLDVEEFDTANVTDMSSMFEGCESLEALDVSGFDTSNVTSMSSMFKKCGSLASLDVSGFITSNVTNLSHMFDRCENLKTLDVAGFDTVRAENMNTMFQLCAALETLDVSGFNTSSVTALDYMFNKCASLKTLDVSGFDTKRVANLKYMFSGCEALEEIRMGKDFVVANGADTKNMFAKTAVRIVLDGKTMTPEVWLNGDTPSATEAPATEAPATEAPATEAPATEAPATEASAIETPATEASAIETPAAEALAFRAGRSRLRSDVLNDDQLSDTTGTVLGSDIDRSNVLSIDFLSSLDSAPDSAWDVSEAGDGSVLAWFRDGALSVAGDGGVLAPRDSRGLFANYTRVEAIRFNDSFDTSETTSMYAMFSMDSSLTALDVSQMNTANVTDMFAMFNACNALVSLDVSGFDTSKVTNMGGMFYNCAALEELDVSGFDTSGVTDMNSMFHNCERLKDLDVSRFDTANVRRFNSMFQRCALLQSLDVSGFNTANATSMRYMFGNCKSLEKIVFTSLDLSNTTDMGYMFFGCSELKALWVSDDTPAGRQDIDVQNMFDQSPLAMVYSGAVCMYPEEWLGNEVTEKDAPRLRADRIEDMSLEDQDNKTYRVLGSDVLRSEIAILEFANALNDAPTDSWDVSEAGDGSVLAWIKESEEGRVLIIAGEGGVGAPLSSEDLFAEYTALKKIRFNGYFFTGQTRSMKAMFAHDSALVSLNLNRFNTALVTDMSSMFSMCSSLESLEVTRFDTSNVTDMYMMFYDCAALKSLDLSAFDTSAVTNMSYMFASDVSLGRVTLSGFDTAAVRDFSAMFKNCQALDEIAVGDGFVFTDDGSLEKWQMFQGCDAGVILNGQTMSLEKWELTATLQMASEQVAGRTPDAAPTASDFEGTRRLRGDALILEEAGGHAGSVLGSGISRDDVQKITIADSMNDVPEDAWDVSEAVDGSVMAWFDNGVLTIAGQGGVIAPLNAKELFANYTSLEAISFNGCFSTSDTTDMSYMFFGDSRLTALDVSCFDTRQVETMQAMFSGCDNLEALNVSEFDTCNVTDMSGMFYNCNRLKSLDVSRFSTGSTTTMQAMFFNCDRLSALDVSGFDTGLVTDMSFMFRGCGDLRTLDVTRFDTAKVTDMKSMFAECRSLTRLDVSSFNTAEIRYFNQMFMNCTRLDELTVGDAFVALGDQAPEDEDMLANGPLHIRNGDDVIEPGRWQEIIRLSSGLQKGDKGTSVEWMQRILARLGYLGGATDGIFGKKTQNALETFQTSCGLEPTGVADEETMKALVRQAVS